MPPLVQFHALRLPDSFPDSLDQTHSLTDQYADLYLSPSTLGGLLRPPLQLILTDRRSVLQLAVLSLPCLQHSRERVIVDQDQNTERRLSCPQLPQLVDNLARALLLYDDDMSPDIAPRQAYARKTAASVRWLETMARCYRDDVRHKQLLRPRLRPTPLKRASYVYTNLQEELEEKAYARWEERWRTTQKDMLTWLLWHEVRRHAPETRPYPMRAVAHIVATVMKAFGIETDKEDEIAARLYNQRGELNRTIF